MDHGPTFSMHEKAVRISMRTYSIFVIKLPPSFINTPNRVFPCSYAQDPGPSNRRTLPSSVATIHLPKPSQISYAKRCVT